MTNHISYFDRDTFLKESIILEFRKGKENDIKKQTNKNLSDSCNLWWSLNPKVAKGEKNHQNGLMVERKEGGLCSFLGAQSHTHRGLCSWRVSLSHPLPTQDEDFLYRESAFPWVQEVFTLELQS